MQTTTARFEQLARADVRPIKASNRIAFSKTLDPSIKYFTLDDSLLDDVDILGFDGGFVQIWDRYIFDDYSDRIISQEITRSRDPIVPVTQSIASFELQNTDGYFTPRGDSPIAEDLKPSRPVRLMGGFGNKTIPLFAGLTDKTPQAEFGSRVASFDATDFLTYVFNLEIGQAIVLEDKRTDEVIDAILQAVGLEPSQYILDEGVNTIAFCYFEPDRLVGGALRDLVQAELGSLYLNESGLIRFENRSSLNNTKVVSYEFASKDIVSIESSDEEDIINSVEIKSSVRKVLPNQVVFSYSQDQNNPVLVPAGSSAEFFFNFDDPVTSLDTIVGFVFNANLDGTGANTTTSMSVTGTTLFATSVKVRFTNSGLVGSYLQQLTMFGTPAKVVSDIRHTAIDQISIDDYGIKKLTIENNFIQSLDDATDFASYILTFYSMFDAMVEAGVKGNPALQINDFVKINSPISNYNGLYIVDKIIDSYSSNQYKQRLRLRPSPITNPFTLDVSILDGPDMLGF